MHIMWTHFNLFYEYVLIQEQSYGHLDNNTCLLTKCLPDYDNDVYWSKWAVSFMKSILN
jgi:hypothetical protein